LRCDNKGRTLTIFESDEGFISAGYASVPWSSSVNKDQEDNEAFLISLQEGMMDIFRPKNPQFSLYHDVKFGPCFSFALGVTGIIGTMNLPGNGISNKDNNFNKAGYEITEIGE
jgi:hypothetical protein